MSAFTSRDLEKAILRELRPYYENPDYEEVAICQPGQIFAKLRAPETREEGNPVLWKELRAPELTHEYLTRAIRGISNIYGKQYHEKHNPVCFTEIHDRHRFTAATGASIVYDEAQPEGGICMAIRQRSRPPDPAWKENLARYGLSERDRISKDRRLISASEERKQAEEIMRRKGRSETVEADPGMEKQILKAAREGTPILISGVTGSGKTTLLNQLLMQVDLNYRVISIEDTRELIVPHRNRIQIMIGRGEAAGSKEDKIQDTLTPGQVIDLVLRLTPEVIMAGEISVTNGFLAYTMMSTGHQHFWTTIHAKNVDKAHHLFAQRIQMSWPGKRGMELEELQQEIAEGMLTIQTEKVDGYRRRIVDAREPASWGKTKKEAGSAS